jgi:hypothetical protein
MRWHLPTRLIADRFLEAKSVGIEVVARYQKHFTPSLLNRWKRWLADRPFRELGNHRYDLRCADRPIAAAVSRKGR